MVGITGEGVYQDLPIQLGRRQEKEDPGSKPRTRGWEAFRRGGLGRGMVVPRCLGSSCSCTRCMPMSGPSDAKEAQAFQQEAREPLHEPGAGLDPLQAPGLPLREG